MDAIESQRTARRIVFLACLIAATAWVAQAHTSKRETALGAVGASVVQPPSQQPQIDVVFALDTTGSMGGLIEGAKQKIWSIASAMADGKPSPRIRIGLVAYRDRGDAYITQRMDLTDDIDRVYARLQALQAGGGGDGPESVNQALEEAVSQMSWSPGDDVYKVVFLVGDAPPHMDYQDDTKYRDSVERARENGITINTVQCGSQPDTRTIWTEIAMQGAGQFVAIRQDGAMIALETPMDDELARLNRELGDTVVAYGGAADKNEIARKIEAAKSAAPAVTASRLGYLSKRGGRLNSGRRDLVDAVKDGVADLAAVPESELPAEMAPLDAAERREYIEAKTAERAQIQERIDSLARKREEHLREQSKQLVADGDGAGFDLQVLEAIRGQAAAKGITYE